MRAFLVLLLVGAVGCATSHVLVPDNEWQTVPEAERARLDREHAAEIAKADAERTAARVALTKARAAAAPKPMQAAPATAATGDEWASAMAQYEASKRTAIASVNEATAAWQRARIAFYERRVELVDANAAVLDSAYEVTRAKAVDRHRLGFDTYDSADFRGQLASAQERWYVAETRATAAREALASATAKLAAAKDAYASLVRSGPNAPTSEDRSMQLASWKDQPLRARTSWRVRTTAKSGRYLTLGGRVARK
jgi:hypothetical protein